MDAGWAAILGALVGAAGASVVAWINRGAARQAALTTVAGQRQMALDEARRRWRQQLVQPLLDHLKGRVHAYGEVWDAIAADNPAMARAVLQRIGHPTSSLQDSAWDAIADEHFRDAAAHALKLDDQLYQLLRRLQGQSTSGEREATSHEINVKMTELADAIRDVYSQAETYALPTESIE